MAGLGASRLPTKAIRWTISGLFRHKIHLLCFVLLFIFVWLIWAHTINLDPLDGLDYKLFVGCQEFNDQVLSNATEINKVVGAAATTLMTLLPALLVFGPFPTADIRAMIPYSTAAAFITSGFTLGLATSNLLTIGKNRILSVVELCTQDAIRIYSIQEASRLGISGLYMPRISTRVDTMGTLMTQDLVLPVFRAFMPENDIHDLRDLMDCALLEASRAKRGYLSLMSLVFMLIQAGLLVLLLGFAPDLLRINIVWICHDSPLTHIVLLSWLLSTIVLAGVIRTFAVSSFFSADEVLHLSPITPATSLGTCDYCSLAAAAPLTRVLGPIAHARSYLRRNYGALHFSIRHNPKARAFPTGVIPLLKSFFVIQNSRHPMVLILRQAADDGRYAMRPMTLLFGVLGGFIQALLLISLTILFGSTFDSGIFQAAIFVVFFIAVMVSSRTYSIYYCLWMEQAVNTTIIEYQTPVELRAIKTILAGMPMVVVENVTDGSKYSAGHRLDQNPDCASHPSSPCSSPHPRTFGRVVGLVVGVVFTAPLVYFCVTLFQITTQQWSVVSLVNFLSFLMVILFGLACVVSKIISDFDFIAIHRGNSVPAVTTEPLPI